ncbi:MAG: DUF58 domain-containing protein [Clostridia bacterium]|nr:DUF58 domain-containing protein [Clostridia bacterium]
MGKGFSIYVFVCLTVLIFGFAFSNMYFLVLFLLFILAPFVSRALMKIDASHIDIQVNVDSDCVQCDNVKFNIIVSSTKRIMAQGLCYLTFEVTYHKYNEVRTRRIKIPVTNKLGTITVMMSPDLCSAVTIKCVSAESDDMLGITKISVKKPKPFTFMVYPKMLPINLSSYNYSLTDSDTQRTQITKNGSDYSDVQDFKEYTPGDSIKAIHWKLSSKSDKYIIKIGSDNTSINTLIFFNLGKSDLYGDEKLQNQVLSASIQLGFSISSKLLENGISHEICSVAQNGLEFYGIKDFDSFTSAERSILMSTVPNENKTGVKYLLSDPQIREYAKIICICCEDNTNEAEHLALYSDVTVLVISKDETNIATTQNSAAKVIKLPLENINETQYNIEI